MKILELMPKQYDWGIHILTFGKLNRIYEHLTSYIESGHRVLDIGCGTGMLTLKAAQKGAKLKSIDINPQLLDIAKKRAEEMNLLQNIEFCEMGVAELGSEKSESYDVVMNGLCFSELSEDEMFYTLKEVKRILKPGGILLIADEIKPMNFFKRILNGIVKFPLLIITYLITQTTTNALQNLPENLEDLGFEIEFVKINKMENFIELVARKPLLEKK